MAYVLESVLVLTERVSTENSLTVSVPQCLHLSSESSGTYLLGCGDFEHQIGECVGS